MTRKSEHLVSVKNLTVAYGDRVVLHDVSFDVNAGDVFVIMGMSGCGKSTIMRSMIGLLRPAGGQIFVDGVDLWACDDLARKNIIETFGISYQGGALFSSMTVGENVGLPMELKHSFAPREINKRVREKLQMVGLDGYQDLYPAEISGGMIKRVALARAMILKPRILFFDEPSAGLDPVRSAGLDKLIRDINRKTGTTVVMVTHELPSIMDIATNSVYLDAETKTVGAVGAPQDILRTTRNRKILDFLTRDKTYKWSKK